MNLGGRKVEEAQRHLGTNLKSILHRCHTILVTFVWELTEETINLPPGCLQGGKPRAGEVEEAEGHLRGEREGYLAHTPLVTGPR